MSVAPCSGIQFMPESPRWLLRQGRDVDAKRAIQRVKSVPYNGKSTLGRTLVQANEFYGAVEDDDVNKMFNEQKDAIDYENKVGKASWFDCFRPGNKTLYRTILGMTLQALQQLTG